MKRINVKEQPAIFLRVSLFALFLVVLLAGAPAQATLYEYHEYASRTTFNAALPFTFVETWDEFLDGTTFANGSSHNHITYTVSSSDPLVPAGEAMVTNVWACTTNPNGLGEAPYTYFAYATDSITFTFQWPIFAFAIDINNNAMADGTFQATTNVSGVSASSHYDPFPGLDSDGNPYTTGQFIGFTSDQYFTSVTIGVSPGFSIAEGWTLDTMRYLPLPPSLLLLGSGLAGLGLWRGRKRFKP
jgi:hypothetical protein